MAGALIDAGAPDHDITHWLDVAASVDPGDWRAQWYRGQAALARDVPGRRMLRRVLAEVPGELAPKLALGYAYELSGQLEPAAGYFNLVSKADSSYTSAAFGLARCERARADPAGAVEALERVPASSSRYETARLAIAKVLLDDAHTTPGQPELQRAAEALQPLRASVDSLAVHRLAARLLLATARLIESDPGAVSPDSGDLLGTSMHPTEFRAAAERELRACARLAPSRARRCTSSTRPTVPDPSPSSDPSRPEPGRRRRRRKPVRPSRRADRTARTSVRRTRRADRTARTSVRRTRRPAPPPRRRTPAPEVRRGRARRAASRQHRATGSAKRTARPSIRPIRP